MAKQAVFYDTETGQISDAVKAALSESIRDTMGTTLVAGANVTITPDDGADTITITAATGGSGGGVTTALYLPGTSGNHVTTPHVAGAQVGDSMDIRIDLDPTTWDFSATTGLAGKGTSGLAAGLSWGLFGVTSRRLQLTVSDGTATSNPLLTGALTGITGRTRLRVTYTRDTGSGSGQHVAYTSTDFDTPLSDVTAWTQSATSAPASIGATNDVATEVTAGSSRSNASGGPGTFYGFALLVDGALVCEWRADVPATRLRGPVGETWTVNGTANAWEIG